MSHPISAGVSFQQLKTWGEGSRKRGAELNSALYRHILSVSEQWSAPPLTSTSDFAPTSPWRTSARRLSRPHQKQRQYVSLYQMHRKLSPGGTPIFGSCTRSRQTLHSFRDWTLHLQPCTRTLHPCHIRLTAVQRPRTRIRLSRPQFRQAADQNAAQSRLCH